MALVVKRRLLKTRGNVVADVGRERQLPHIQCPQQLAQLRYAPLIHELRDPERVLEVAR